MTEDHDNVVPLFPDGPPKRSPNRGRSKMARHQHSALEVLLIAVAGRAGVDREIIEQELCAALDVDDWQQADQAQAAVWLRDRMRR